MICFELDNEQENLLRDWQENHDCKYRLPMINQDTVDDSTEHWLDKIEAQLAYDAWMCGHWHINKRIDKLYFLFHDFEAASQLYLPIAQEGGNQRNGI